MGMTWICRSSRTNGMFHILQELGAERKVSDEHRSTLCLYLSESILYVLIICNLLVMTHL